MITLDSSGMFELLDGAAKHHRRAREALMRERPPFLVPAGVLGELAYMVEGRLGSAALDSMLEDVETGAYVMDCGDRDVPRIRHLMRRYQDLDLGFADAAVIACAERNGGRVLTLDERDFGVVAREGQITLVP